MKLLAASVLVITVLAGGSYVLANDGARSAAVSPTMVQTFTAPQSARIEPGVTLYTGEGVRVGAIRAVTRRADQLRTVYVGSTAYDGEGVAFVAGRAVLAE